MRIMIQIGHPAHVHFYKNFIWSMQNEGHDILIVCKDKDIAISLLDNYGFNFEVISGKMLNGIGRIKKQFEYEFNTYKIARKFKPNIITGIGGTAASHVSKMIGSKSIIFTDNFLNLDRYLTHPWADVIITPTSFSHNLGPKQIRVSSYKELAYLHPDLFTPNPDIFSFLGIKESEKFVIVRFVSFEAAHDINVSGFNIDDKIRLVKSIQNYAKVFISSEGKLPSELDKFSIKFPPEKIHDAIYYADLLVADSQTMTTEAAILGTPAVRCNDWVSSKNEMLNFIELERKYGLIHNFSNSSLAIEKCCELLNQDNLKEQYRLKSLKLLDEKINLTKFLIWFFEYYVSNGKYMQDFYTKYIDEHLSQTLKM